MDQLIGMPRYWKKSSFPSNRFSFQDNKMVEVSSIVPLAALFWLQLQ